MVQSKAKVQVHVRGGEGGGGSLIDISRIWWYLLNVESWMEVQKKRYFIPLLSNLYLAFYAY